MTTKYKVGDRVFAHLPRPSRGDYTERTITEIYGDLEDGPTYLLDGILVGTQCDISPTKIDADVAALENMRQYLGDRLALFELSRREDDNAFPAQVYVSDVGNFGEYHLARTADFTTDLDAGFVHKTRIAANAFVVKCILDRLQELYERLDQNLTMEKLQKRRETRGGAHRPKNFNL